MGLFRSNEELQFGTCDLIANHVRVPRNTGEEHYFVNLGVGRGPVINKESIGGN